MPHDTDIFATVKQAARGRWAEVLATVCGWSSELLDGKHHPCPRCGGKDRFRFTNVDDDGSIFCNQCCRDAGDGIAAVAWGRECSLRQAAERVAEHLQCDTPQSPVGSQRFIATYDYRDEAGKLVMQVVRLWPKKFRQRQPKPGRGWNWSVKGLRVLPYRLPELLSDPQATVFVPEGEKDVDSLRRLGLVATCNAGGAKKWTSAHAQHLRDRHVVVLQDNDDAGRAHGRQVAESLDGIAATVRVVDLPGLAVAGDVSDWIAAGGTRAALEQLVEATPLWRPGAEPWPELLPLDIHDPPAFPTDALPAVLRDWVSAESTATQTPADLAGLLSLAVCSAVLARRVVVEARPGWIEPVNLFVSVLLEPGNRKSAVFADALRPLRDLEAELIEAARPMVAAQQSARRQDEARLKKLEKKSAERADPAARDEAVALSIQLSCEPEPELPRLLVDDATVEKLGMILAAQGGRIASMSPEGGVFDLMAGLYSKSGMPQFGLYLLGHSGDDLLTDRVGRPGVRVERPALTCAYAMQPAVIEGLAQQTAFRGRGLLARFLYAAPKSWIGRREICPPPVPDQVSEAYHQLVRQLGSIVNCVTDSPNLNSMFGDEADNGHPEVSEGSNVNTVNEFPDTESLAPPPSMVQNSTVHSETVNSVSFVNIDQEVHLKLSPSSHNILIEWETEIERMLDDGGSLERMKDWGAKLAGATLRLAGVMHCVTDDISQAIGDETLSNAIRLARYLIPHAETVLGMMQASEDLTELDVRYVLQWILRQGEDHFTRRDVHRHGQNRFKTVEDVDPALVALTKRGYIRPKPCEVTGPGRPSSPEYEVRPDIFDLPGSGDKIDNIHSTVRTANLQVQESSDRIDNTQFGVEPAKLQLPQSSDKIDKSHAASPAPNSSLSESADSIDKNPGREHLTEEALSCLAAPEPSDTSHRIQVSL
ncbi:MAG: DUF3987 domain-containing protein [Pirellulales bacterium]